MAAENLGSSFRDFRNSSRDLAVSCLALQRHLRIDSVCDTLYAFLLYLSRAREETSSCYQLVVPLATSMTRRHLS